jgi:nucleotide-binding universal stress UspA family protein
LVHVLVPVIVGDALMQYTMVDVETPQQAKDYLNGLLTRLPKPPGKPPAVRVLDGAVTQVISEYAQTNHADLLVMTTHGRGPMSRAWLGSVADELIRHVSVPLLLLRPEDEKPATPGPSEFKNILIALDGTIRSEAIVSPSEELAKMFGAEVTFIRVVPPGPVHGLELVGKPYASDSLEMWRQMRLAANEQLTKQAGTLTKHGLSVRTLLIEHNHAAQAILEEAKKQKCDLIAMETHGRAGISRMVFGSVADKVIRGTTCAVLVHRTG